VNTPLAPHACHPERSRGRRVPEPAVAPDSEHACDLDRIVHSTAFRRLMYKTQVFVNHEGDLFRTRLTHSIEVAQLSRGLARRLRLNADLMEAIALAHDLGHTPFGHAGQEALQRCMDGHGGFEHNLQSLRVVDTLEQRYAAFDGLNLSFETREGILKHCSRPRAEQLLATEPDGVARRFVDGTQPSLEAQLVNLADEIAYSAHDIDDGVRSGLLTIEQVATVPLFDRARREALAEHPGLASRAGSRLLYETLRRIVAALVDGLAASTSEALSQSAPADADAVRALPALAGFPSPLRERFVEMKRFLFASLYRHPQVVDTTGCARQVVADLFVAYSSAPGEMPPRFAAAEDRHRAVADFVAGMTDRFALREHHRLTGRSAFPQAA
jgi:dGTPase